MRPLFLVFLQPSDWLQINYFKVWHYAAKIVQNALLINKIYVPQEMAFSGKLYPQ